MVQGKDPTLFRILFMNIGVLFVGAAIIIVVLVNIHMRNQALVEAESKALLLLDHNLATHTYFSHQLKPTVFQISSSSMPKDYFEPAWMSSTFAIRGIMTHFKELNSIAYYYKECAINARSVENEADEYEKQYLIEANSDSELPTRSSVRIIDGKEYFTLLRRGETMEQSCLRCHDTPDQAPAGMLATYGSERSFNRSVGDILSAVSIRIPLSEAYGSANRVSFQLSFFLVVVLLVMYGVLFWITKYRALTPLSEIRDAALLIADSTTHLGETIRKRKGREFGELSTAFNKMSRSLKESHDGLEQQVMKRTQDLTNTNKILLHEKDNLKKALAEIRTLKGILPICASCKQIRDDKGYWKQMESYISEHSEAEFSHGICPECMKKDYPEEYAMIYPDG